MMRHVVRAGTFVAVLLASAALAADETDADGAWDVDDPGGPYRDFPLDVDEGTWMSVDVSPDGERLVFDLLGDIWTVQIGRAHV